MLRDSVTTPIERDGEMRVRTIVALGVAVLVTACGKKVETRAARPDSIFHPPVGPSRLATIEGFKTPESVIYDVDQDVWFVTNINGNASAVDDNGFISRLKADGTVDSLRFIAGGVAKVTLNAPKGTAIVGDTLWVTDINAVRGFNRKTGQPVATVEFGSKAKFLNDIVAGPDGSLYVTDTGILFDSKGNMTHPGPDRIFKIGAKHVVTIAADGDVLERPNGIAWDAAGQRYMLAPFGGTTIASWTPGQAPVPFAKGPGSQDGIEVLSDGRVLVTSWADSTLFIASPGGNKVIVSKVATPADIGIDRGRHVVAIPLFTLDKVEFWDIGS
jgi:sugar lactone lactonase YvrE